MKKYIRGLLILSIFIILIVGRNNIANADSLKNILFISSYNPNSIHFYDQVTGVKEGFNYEVQIQIEYMDYNVFYTENEEERFYNLLKEKIDNYRNFDAIITGDDEALEFVLKYRNDLFKNMPISFIGVEDNKLIEKALEYDKVSGVEEKNSVAENIELIIKLHKDVRNITCINWNPIENFDSIVEEQKGKYPNINIEQVISSELYYEEFEKLICDMDKDDAIVMLYPCSYKDRPWVEPAIIFNEISKLDTVPIYTVTTYGIGACYIGGMVVSQVEQGIKGAQIASGILDGKDTKSLYKNNQSINNYVFDYNELKEYGISEKDLPNNYEILNKPISVFEKYKGIWIPLILVLIFLISIIILLVIHSIHCEIYERKLLKAKKNAEDANRAKGNFISNISHELRTPVSVIMSSNQLLHLKLNRMYKNTDNNFERDLSVINQNCYRLIRLINNIIDIAKVDSGFNEINLVNVNIIELLEKIVLSVVSYSESKNIDIIFDTNIEELVMAVDLDKVERIVLNLLSNAIKFSKEYGVINIDVTASDDSVVFVVKDNGIGIADSDLEKIFDKFIQVDNTFTRKNEGSGVGLSIVKSFIEMHGGEIKVKSKLGEGSAFIVKLPVVVSDVAESYQITEEYSQILSTKVEFSDIYF